MKRAVKIRIANAIAKKVVGLVMEGVGRGNLPVCVNFPSDLETLSFARERVRREVRKALPRYKVMFSWKRKEVRVDKWTVFVPKGSPKREQGQDTQHEKKVYNQGKVIPVLDESYFDLPADIHIIKGTIEGKEPVWLFGPSGCGKSSLAVLMAEQTGNGWERFSCHGQTEAYNLIGQWKLTNYSADEVQVWIDGPLLRCMRQGKWLIIDEMDSAEGSVALVLQRVLEDGKILLDHEGEIVPHENFRIVATANTKGRGDMDRLYVRNIQDEAFLDRFSFFSIKYSLHEKLILVKKTGIDPQVAAKMIEVAQRVRARIESGALNITFGTRRLLKWAKACKAWTVDGHFEAYTRFEDEEAIEIKELIQRIFGDS